MKNIYLKFFILLFAALNASCSDVTVSDTPRLVLKGAALDIPINEPSVLTDDCGTDIDFSEINEFGCIAFPFSSEEDDGKDWEREYGRLLNENGWDWKGGEANVYFFEKTIDDNCSYSLAMIGWFQGNSEQTKAYQETGSLEGVENGLFIFGIEPEPVCGNNRRKW